MAKLQALGWDYFTFALFIILTVFMPLWKRLFGAKKQRSKADHVFATGGISIMAIMISMSRGTLGVRTVLGYPSELYYRGSAMWEIIYGYIAAYPIVCFVFVPVYFNLGITSVYQYIDLRFKSRLVRRLASATYMLRQILVLGITIYTPSVALAAVIGIPYWASIVGMSMLCIFFSMMGGLKAAINADVIQTISIVVVSVAVIIKGAIASGGPQKVYELNRDNGRLKFFDFTGDMTVRVDTTSALLGQLFISLTQFGCQQNFMQRYISLKSMANVKVAMMSNIPIIFVFFSLSWLCGTVIYSTYIACDPFAAGYIDKPDAILPFFVEDQLAFIPGFVGIFMATLFNGAMCMMVSNLNSLATVCWEDFLSTLPQCRELGDKQQLNIIKVMTVVFGCIIMCIAFGVGLFSGVIESSMLAFSVTVGPLLGCFILAMLVPIANWKGAAAGMITSCIFVLWITIGSTTIDKGPSNNFLPTSTDGCTNQTFSAGIQRPHAQTSWLMANTPTSTASTLLNETLLTAPTTAAEERTPLEYMYSISYMYFCLFGTAITVILGFIISYLTQDPKDAYDSKLLHPLIFKLSQKFEGRKPYYIKGVDDDLTTGINAEKSAKINDGFEPQNEAIFINGISEKSTEKNAMQVVFTNGNNLTSQIAENSTKSDLQTLDVNKCGTYRQFSDKSAV